MQKQDQILCDEIRPAGDEKNNERQGSIKPYSSKEADY